MQSEYIFPVSWLEEVYPVKAQKHIVGEEKGLIFIFNLEQRTCSL